MRSSDARKVMKLKIPRPGTFSGLRRRVMTVSRMMTASAAAQIAKSRTPRRLRGGWGCCWTGNIGERFGEGIRMVGGTVHAEFAERRRKAVLSAPPRAPRETVL